MAEVTVVLASPQGQQLTRFYVAPDGQHALVGEIIPFGAQPFDPAKQLLEKGITGPERGPKDAPVTIVEFGDLQCPACKAAQPTIEALVAAEPTARFVFQNFPLEMHNWAAKGAAYADCVGRASNDAFWKFVSKTYETQSDITAENADEKLTAIADGAGVKGADIAACAAKPETKAHVDASIALGKSVDVTGTPTAFYQWTQDRQASIPACRMCTRAWSISPRSKQNSSELPVVGFRTNHGLELGFLQVEGGSEAGKRKPEARSPISYFSPSQISGVVRLKFASTCGVMTIMSSSLSDSLVLVTIA